MSALISGLLFVAALTLYSLKAGRHRLWFLVVMVLLLTWLLLTATLVASNYFTGDGITDAVLYTLSNSLQGAGIGKYLMPAIGLLVSLLLISGAVAWMLRRKQQRYHPWWSLCACLLALLSIKVSPAYQQVKQLVWSQSHHQDSDFERYYKVPKEKIDQPKLNLVYIYAESLERTYFNQQAFPELAPELSHEMQQSMDFTQTMQLPGTDYTIAGIVASQCGIPLFAPFEGNASSSLSSFYPQNLCLGDILKNSGYDNWFIQGADLRFAGKDVFFKSHGFDPKNLIGFQELKSQVPDPNYRNNWGFYDDTVLDKVFEKYQQLSAQKQPFALFALTVDTHHPDGYISRTCPQQSYTYEGKMNQSFSAVTCSQYHIAKLIERIKASPSFKNTVIVVGSDHLAMNNTAWKALNKQPRHDLFFVIRGDKPEAQQLSDVRSTLDNGATVLDILGGDNFLGLGRSSISNQSLAATLHPFKEKVLDWKADIVQLWNFPKKIDDFTIDTQKNTFSFSNSVFHLPILVRIMPDKVEPIPEGTYVTALSTKLSRFKANEQFIWVDKCYKLGRIWQPQLALSQDWCISQGRLGNQPDIQTIKDSPYSGKVIPATQPIDQQKYTQVVAALALPENEIRYPSEDYVFSLPGAPVTVKSFAGLSRPEAWGRWSNANLGNDVVITYNHPLPKKFTLKITAKAFAANIGQPVTVTIGQQHYQFTPTDQLAEYSLPIKLTQESTILTLHPYQPISSNLDNIIGQAPRKIAFGLAHLAIIPED